MFENEQTRRFWSIKILFISMIDLTKILIYLFSVKINAAILFLT